MNARNAFAVRNTKEILRDPLTLAFGLGFPVVLLLLLTAIQSNIPVSLFELDRLTPGIAVFGLSFISLFSAMLISKDRTTSFLMRLFASPMRASDYILGYTLPLLPMALLQLALCYGTAMLLGLKFTPNILLAIVVALPAALLFTNAPVRDPSSASRFRRPRPSSSGTSAQSPSVHVRRPRRAIGRLC